MGEAAILAQPSPGVKGDTSGNYLGRICECGGNLAPTCARRVGDPPDRLDPCDRRQGPYPQSTELDKTRRATCQTYGCQRSATSTSRRASSRRAATCRCSSP